MEEEDDADADEEVDKEGEIMKMREVDKKKRKMMTLKERTMMTLKERKMMTLRDEDKKGKTAAEDEDRCDQVEQATEDERKEKITDGEQEDCQGQNRNQEEVSETKVPLCRS